MESQDSPIKHVGDFPFICGICETLVPIPVYAGIDLSEDGRLYLHTAPDSSVIWLHLWTEHPEEAANDERHD